MSLVCKLCQKEKELKKSHILSEFYYEKLYDPSKKRLHLTNYEKGKFDFHQKGLREYLLCDDCEGILSRSETYVANLLKNSCPSFEIQDLTEIKPVDSKLIYHHQLSLLWRMSVSKTDFFKEVNLGHYEEIIRKFLLGESELGYEIYPCILIANFSQLDIYRHTLLSPIRLTNGIADLFTIMLGGFLWMFVVSDHKTVFHEFDPPIYTTQNTLPILDDTHLQIIEPILFQYYSKLKEHNLLDELKRFTD